MRYSSRPPRATKESGAATTDGHHRAMATPRTPVIATMAGPTASSRMSGVPVGCLVIR